jgi:hypothetical protein
VYFDFPRYELHGDVASSDSGVPEHACRCTKYGIAEDGERCGGYRPCRLISQTQPNIGIAAELI